VLTGAVGDRYSRDPSLPAVAVVVVVGDDDECSVVVVRRNTTAVDYAPLRPRRSTDVTSADEAEMSTVAVAATAGVDDDVCDP